MGVNIKTARTPVSTKAYRASSSDADARKLKHSLRKPRTKKMVREIYQGKPYDYYPLGKYIVAAPDTCRGRPTFKYTRIEVADALNLVAAGWSIEQIAGEWWDKQVSAEALREAVLLANSTLGNALSITSRNQ